MADYSTVDFEIRDKVGYVTLNRPEKLNAINHQMIGELFEVFEEVKFNPDIWAMVITGTGRAFSTGHDLVEMATTQPVGRHGSATAFYQYLQELYKPYKTCNQHHVPSQALLYFLTNDHTLFFLLVVIVSSHFHFPN